MVRRVIGDAIPVRAPRAIAAKEGIGIPSPTACKVSEAGKGCHLKHQYFFQARLTLDPPDAHRRFSGSAGFNGSDLAVCAGEIDIDEATDDATMTGKRTDYLAALGQ